MKERRAGDICHGFSLTKQFIGSKFGESRTAKCRRGGNNSAAVERKCAAAAKTRDRISEKSCFVVPFLSD